MDGQTQGHPVRDDRRRYVERERALAALATQQHGVVARRQLVELGLGRGAIDTRLRTRRFSSIHRGVYSVGHGRLTMRSTWLAAVLACGEGAVLSHRSAAALWGRRGREGAVRTSSLLVGARLECGGWDLFPPA